MISRHQLRIAQSWRTCNGGHSCLKPFKYACFIYTYIWVFRVFFFLLAIKINIPVIEEICWNTENVGLGPLKFRLQLNWADLGQVRQILSIFKGKLLVRVAEGVGEHWCRSSQQIYRHSARELCCSNSCRRWTNRYSSQKWMKAVGLLLGLISEQASAYFINIMKGN